MINRTNVYDRFLVIVGMGEKFVDYLFIACFRIQLFEGFFLTNVVKVERATLNLTYLWLEDDPFFDQIGEAD